MTGIRQCQPITETDPPLYIRQYAVQLDEARKENAALVKALEDVKLLLSAFSNDGKSDAVKECNANQAWHAADRALSHRSAKT